MAERSVKMVSFVPNEGVVFSVVCSANNIRFVTVKDVLTRETFVDQADVVISARGALNDIAWPNIPGLNEMKIPVMHSAAWDQEYVLHGSNLSLIC